MKRIVLMILLMLSALQAEIFMQGDKQVGVTVGAGSGYGSNYTIVGVSGYYFLLEGLSVGLGYRGWFGNNPSIHEVDVPVTYYVPIHPKFRPYAGAFYRRTFVESPYDDYNTYGLRIGGAMRLSPNSYVSAGWVQEYYGNNKFGDSSNGYPELAIGFSF